MKKITYILFLLLVFNSLFSQKIYEESIKNNNFYEIRKAFYDNYNLETDKGMEDAKNMATKTFKNLKDGNGIGNKE